MQHSRLPLIRYPSTFGQKALTWTIKIKQSQQRLSKHYYRNYCFSFNGLMNALNFKFFFRASPYDRRNKHKSQLSLLTLHLLTQLYCNRAAAYSMLKDHSSAVKDRYYHSPPTLCNTVCTSTAYNRTTEDTPISI
jgi:hypothetical protein